jgi:hypothetical protein
MSGSSCGLAQRLLCSRGFHVFIEEWSRDLYVRCNTMKQFSQSDSPLIHHCPPTSWDGLVSAAFQPALTCAGCMLHVSFPAELRGGVRRRSVL